MTTPPLTLADLPTRCRKRIAKLLKLGYSKAHVARCVGVTVKLVKAVEKDGKDGME